MIRFAVLGCVFVLGQMVSALNLYPAHIAERVAQAKGISAPCLAAINSSIACDEALFGQTPSPDQYLWHADDLLTLCSSTCTSSLQNWQSAVESACSGQTMFHAGQIMEPKMLTMLYISGYDLICLKSSQNGWCMLEEQAWQGSKIRRYPRDYCATRDPEFDGEECFTEGFQQTLVEPEDERLINLYPSEMLCSDCFVKVMHRRLSSPLLISSDFNDYLVEQFHDIEQFCTTSIPLTTATRTYYKGTMTPDATTATPAPPVTTCAGPFVQAGSVPNGLDLRVLALDGLKLQAKWIFSQHLADGWIS